MLHLIRFWLPGCRYIALFRTFPSLAWSLHLDPNAPNTKLFSPKNHVLLSNFFSSSNMFFIRLFLANTWGKKIGGHRACFLTNCCERWTGFQIAVRMDNLRGGDWGEIQTKAHRVRSMHSRSSLFSVVFMCLISPAQKLKLEKNTLNTKEWGKSRFDENLELWIFIFDYFVTPTFCLIPVS